MDEFGIKIIKVTNGYLSTFWFLDENRIVVEKNKIFLTRFFAMRWSRKQICNKIADQHIKEK